MAYAAIENTVQNSLDAAERSAPLDHAHLARYTMSDRTLEYEILRLFLAQIPLTLESLKFASMDRDWVIAAHTLKGSARAVGVRRLAELALEAEQLGGISDWASCDAIIEQIETEARSVERYVAQHYGA